MISVEKPGSPAEVLMHYGKKGMRWGVRRAYETRLAGTAARNRRVGEGGGSARDKLATGLTTNALSVVRARGNVRRAAIRRAQIQEAHVRRMQNGEMNALDTLKFVGGLRITDLARATKRQ